MAFIGTDGGSIPPCAQITLKKEKKNEFFRVIKKEKKMNFIKLSHKVGPIPIKENMDKLRISYRYKKDTNNQIVNREVKLYIGTNILDQVGIYDGDKVKFLFEEENPKIWLIKKSNDIKGYRIRKYQMTSYRLIKIPRTFFKIYKNLYKNQDKEEIVNVKFDFYEDGIIIYSDQTI